MASGRARGDHPAVDVTRLLASVSGREQIARSMAKRFLLDAPVFLKDLTDALGSNDRKGVHLVAHRLKGALMMLRAHCASQIAGQLELTAHDGPGERLEALKSDLYDEVRRVSDELLLFLDRDLLAFEQST